MTKPKQHVSGDNSVFDLIPVDLIITILSRLPVKSIAQCRCVSKLWSSIIRRPYYNLLFPIKFPPTPRFLFIVRKGVSGPGVFLFSSAQNQNPGKFSYIVANLDTSSTTGYCRICPPVNGFVCRQHTGEGYTFAVISNPITGEYVTTPKLTTDWIQSRVKIYFGYDPIGEQFKVLCIIWRWCGGGSEYHVLTLGTGNLSWRKIQCCILHNPRFCEYDGICINGLLYYEAMNEQKLLIVCFDVWSEKFSLVNIGQYLATNIGEPLTLINYKGSKLGAIHCYNSKIFDLLVLENADEHKWSHLSYKMPEVLRPHRQVSFSAGMIGSGEVVLCPKDVRNPFHIVYYNLEKNIITTVSLEDLALDYKKTLPWSLHISKLCRGCKAYVKGSPYASVNFFGSKQNYPHDLCLCLYVFVWSFGENFLKLVFPLSIWL